MPHFISNIVGALPGFIESGGYWIIAAIVIFEGIPALGTFIPGHFVVIIAGFLVKLEILNFPLVLLVATVSAVLGDLIGFLIGRKYGYSFLKRFGGYIYLKDEHIEKAKRLIDSHCGKALILGKFSPFTRSFTPFFVGASKVNTKTFLLWNIIGAFLWVFLSVLVGYIFGAGYHSAVQFLGKFIPIAILFSIIIIWAYRFVNVRFHIFKKYEIFVLILNLVSLWGLIKTVEDTLFTYSFMKEFDIWVNIFMSEHVGNVLSKTAYFVSLFGGTTVLISLGMIVGIGFLLKKKWRRGAIMILSIVSTSAILILIKDIVMRPRPENALYMLSDSSFPSGHAGISAAFFVVLAYILVPRIHYWVKREVVLVLCIVTPLLIGLSRVMMNVHWASDVIAGWSLGIFLATGSILFVKYVSAIIIKYYQNKK